MQKSLCLAVASLLAVVSANAGETEMPAAATPAPPAAASVPAAVPSQTAPVETGKDAPQPAGSDILSNSAKPASNCYSGFHTSLDYNITGAALTALGRKVIEPGGLCDQYRQYSADMPIEIGVPVLPGVSVNIDKLCKMVERPPCPEQPVEDQAKK